MGRKSRRNTKNTIETAPAIQAGQGIFPTAIYARLSVENGGKNDGGAAISNQIEVCREYIEECADLQLVKVYEDNGWTGTVMRRPAFDELMEEVRRGTIRAIVVRDLSRFGRNYIETGTYLEKIFPKLDVRFISVKERFDTFTVDKSNESLMVPLQNLINDLYSKDISRKVEAALHVQMEEGTFAWRHIPYGYRWDNEHKNIIPDETTAPVVRNIFQWSAQGLSRAEITKRLDALHIPKPCGEDGKMQRTWSRSTIYGILSNPAYIGKRVYGRTHSAIYKGIKKKKMPEKDWYVIENAQEPLVTEEVYNKVKDKRDENSRIRQESMEKTAQARAKLVNLFEKRIFCADCGHKLYFHRYRMDCKDRHWAAEYYCSSSQMRKHLGCTYHRITQESLHEKVLAALRTQIEVALDYEEVIRKYRDSKADKAVQRRMDSNIREISRKMKALQAKKRGLYEDLSEKIISAEEYSFAKENYDKDYETLSRLYDSLAQERAEYREMVSPENKWIRMMKDIQDVDNISQALVDTAVERVLVYEGGAIEIVMKYQDIFELTRNYVREIQGQEASGKVSENRDYTREIQRQETSGGVSENRDHVREIQEASGKIPENRDYTGEIQKQEISRKISVNADSGNISEIQGKGEAADGKNRDRHIHPAVNG